MRRQDDLDEDHGRRADGKGSRRDAEEREDWVVRKEGPGGKLIAAGSIGVLLLLFVLQNTERAPVDFLFWNGDFPLWGVILVAAALGFVGGWILGRVRRTRREIERLEKERD